MKTMFSIYMFLLLFCSLSVFSQKDLTINIISGGIERTFALHLPADNPSQNLPLLLCYHGTGGSSAGMAFTGFNGLADKYNFIVAYPQALKIGNDIQWNVYVDDQPGHAGVGVMDAPDDVLFTRDIIKKLKQDYSINVNSVYASGLSNGAFMCYALSMFAYNDIAAIAPVAGNLWGDDMYLGQLLQSGKVTPIPVMHIHGTADAVVDYPDPDNTPNDYQEYPLFVAARGCGAVTYSQVIPIMQNVDKLVFCPPPIEVSLIRITGMGHTWSNGSYNTSAEIVKFFNLDQGSTGLNEESKNNEDNFEISSSVNNVYMNSFQNLFIADSWLRIKLKETASVSIANITGKIIYISQNENGLIYIPTDSFLPGVYFLRIATAHGKLFSKKLLMIH